jgi:4-methylaminobutanoate oxidase (formaldehyde-forming)
MASFVCDEEDVVLVGRETILRDGVGVGYLSSGGYGYTLRKPVGLGYLRRAEGVTDDWALSGRYELVVAEERRPCRVSFAPLYDPKGTRTRG